MRAVQYFRPQALNFSLADSMAHKNLKNVVKVEETKTEEEKSEAETI